MANRDANARAVARPLREKLRLSKVGRWLIHVGMLAVVAGVSYIILLPLLTKISASWMTESDLYDSAVRWIPRSPTMENYRTVWQLMNYPRALVNSLGLALCASALQVAACTWTAYGLARFNFRGKGLLFTLVIFTLMVPPQVLMTPLYLNFRYFSLLGILRSPINLVNTPYPLLFMSLTGTGLRNGLFIYILRQFFKGLPTELEEAAYVDGAGLFRTFYSVMLRQVTPALVVTFLFAFVWQWNESFYTSLLMPRLELMPNALLSIATRYAESQKLASAAAGPATVTPLMLSILDGAGMVLYVTPLLVLFALMQRYFVESVERTGLVG